MDINLKDLPTVIHSCFILHNYCELKNESVNHNDYLAALKYDATFQPSIDTGITINNNEAGGKRIRSTYVKFLE